MEAVGQGLLAIRKEVGRHTTSLEHSMITRPPNLPLASFRIRRLVVAALAVGLWLGVAMLGAQVADPPKRESGQPTTAETADESARSGGESLLREGTEIVDQLGYFRLTGDRVTFFSDDGKYRFVALENLNLERIARVITDNPEQLQWGISGTMTECRGANFIFVRRAALRSRVESAETDF